MANDHKKALIDQLEHRFGGLRRLPGSQSLFAIGDGARVYIRYSKIHPGGRTFFGLRKTDLQQLEGHNSFLCLLLDDGAAPLFIPFADFEEVFRMASPADDGQFKVQLISTSQSRELYIARQGRFNAEGYVGLHLLEESLVANERRSSPRLTHSQVQTLLAGIGRRKGFDIRIPDSDVGKLDWNLVERFDLAGVEPAGFDDVRGILSEIDVIWIAAGSNRIEGLFEVEHSTPIYSGLLRFNDLILTSPSLSRFCIVSNDSRRSLFSRQINRPTFRRSGLSEIVSFLEYPNVLDWHTRIVGIRQDAQ